MKGIAKIKGPKNPIIGEDSFYEVVEFHKGTTVPNPNDIKWKIFKKNFGKWEEAKGNSKIGKRVSFNFSPRSYGKEILVEAYLYDPEMKSPPGLVVKPVLGPRKILNTEILDANGGKITQTPKYGQSITLKVTTQNMPGEILKLSLWERDTFKDSGHDASSNTKLWSGQSKTIDIKGIVEQKIQLTLAMQKEANKGVLDGSEHEFYLLVEAAGMKTISATTQVSNQEVQATVPAKKTAEKPIAKQEPVKIKKAVAPDEKKPDDSNKTVKVAETVKVEGIIAAYFAKEEFTKETTETAGLHQYKFKNDNNNIDKDKIAGIIKKKVDAQVKADKKYTKLEDVTKALTQKSYKKDDAISFNLYKLGANFIRVNSAPLEEEVYVVANTYLLNGKEVTIKIKEKEAVLIGANADLMVLEAKENGAEITTLKATVEDNLAKIKIKLRPKTDEDLKKWKEKLEGGIKDGTFAYKFGSDGNKTKTAEEKKKIAGIIAKKVKDKLAEQKKIAKIEAIEKVLTKDIYNKDEQVTFDVYKKAEEMLWLKAECQGDIKKHEGEFLKKDGEYFVVGNKCFCNRDITLTEFESILKKLRESESMSNTSSLFYADNCKLDDKTNASFIKKLNETFKKFEINTCIRKIHFLAQVYHETDRLQTTKEYGGKDSYKPYVGRGLMQLTWKDGYAGYKAYSGTDVVVDYEKVAEELELTVDTAGWFWKQGKQLSPGSSWSVPTTSYSEYDKSIGKQYPKKEFTYEIDGVSKKYGTVDINLLADADYIDTISWLVNGGGNGRLERRGYLNEIKKIFKYPNDCANANKKSNSKVTIHFDGETALASGISQRTRTILEEVGEASKNYDIYITSTARTPADQARIMYENTKRTGAEVQKGIYANAGDQVVDVYTAGVNSRKSETEIIQDMEDKINELGPSSVSKHLANPLVMNTFDVSIRRLTNSNDFKTEMKKRTELHQLLDENGAYHIEINQ